MKTVDVTREVSPSLAIAFQEFSNRWLQKAVSSPFMQRLLRIRQHSSYKKEPKTVSRFDHSLGAAAMAFELLEHLKSRSALGVSEEERDKLVFLALCHDLGHGPFSHIFEATVVPAFKGSHFEHEDYSVKFAVELASEVGLKFEGETLIRDVIADGGEETPNELFKIISNKQFGLDVDRLDYLRRDAEFYGIKFPFSLEECFNAFCFRPSAEGPKMFLRRESLDFLNRFLRYRYMMFEERYYCFEDARVSVLLGNILVENGPDLNILGRIADPSLYLDLDDRVLEEAAKTSQGPPPKPNSLRWLNWLESGEFYPLVALLRKSAKAGSAKRDISLLLLSEPGLSQDDFLLHDTCVSSLKDVNPNFLVYDEKTESIAKVSEIEGFELFDAVSFKMYVFAVNEEKRDLIADTLRASKEGLERTYGFSLSFGSF